MKLKRIFLSETILVEYKDPSHDLDHKKNDDENIFDSEYVPEFTPLWEKILGPGAIAASVVTMVLAICALAITYQKIKPEQISYKTSIKFTEEKRTEKPEEPELDIEEILVEITIEDISEIIVQDVEVFDHNETSDNEDFAEAKGDPENISQVDFDEKSILDTLGIAGGGSSRKGDRRGGRINLVKNHGGSRRTENSVMEALRWLKRHQDRSGKWSLNTYTNNCGRKGKKGRCSGIGSQEHNIGGTSLALLAFTGRGFDHKVSGEFKTTVNNSMKHLKTVQKNDGCFGSHPKSNHHMYNQAIATFALADLLVISDDNDTLKDSVSKGVKYLQNSQNPFDKGGGWRYINYNKYKKSQRIINDTSVVAWVVMALKTAKNCGVEVDPKGFEGASKWLDTCYYEEKNASEGTFAYYIFDDGRQHFVNNKPFSTTACGVLSRQFMKESKGVSPGCNTLLRSLPDWSGTRDLYYWYYGSLAMFQMGGSYWESWNEAMKPALTKSQNNNRPLCTFGSWNPEGTRYGQRHGGRVYSTSMCALTLEVYYRYAQIK